MDCVSYKKKVVEKYEALYLLVFKEYKSILALKPCEKLQAKENGLD